MHVAFWKKVVVASLAVSLVTAAVSWSPLVGQDTKKEETKKPDSKESDKPKGRLPVFFKDVVTEDQRLSIYEVQMKYEKQIDELAAKIKELQKQQMDEIEKLLSPEQKEKLDKLRSDAQAKADAKKKAKDAKANKEGGGKSEKEATKPAEGNKGK